MPATPTAPPVDPAFLAVPIAHRALHSGRRGLPTFDGRTGGRPENSRAAAQAAITAGYGIEIDLQLSADGVAMVFHDGALDRLTDATGPVRAQDAAALGRIGLSGGDEGIPTFAEILDLVDGRVPLLVELKDQTGDLSAGKDDPEHGLERAAVAAAEGYGGPLAFMSFNPHMVARLATLAPDIPRGLTTAAFAPEHWPGIPPARLADLASIADMDRVGARFVSHDHRDLDRPRLAEVKDQGHAVLTWTVRSPDAERTARRIADTVTFEGYLPG